MTVLHRLSENQFVRWTERLFGKYYERTKVTGIAEICGMYPFVSGEFKPVERCTKRK